MSAASVVPLPPVTANSPLDKGPAEPASGDALPVDYEPFLPDQKYHKTTPPEFLTLTEEQETAHQEVFKRFAVEDYVIPGLKDGEGKLTEEERFYLVSSSLIPSTVCCRF